MTYRLDSNDIVLALAEAPIDPRTGNKVLYGASWLASNISMIGHRNEEWVRRELAWFISGSNDLGDMEQPIPTAFANCADSDNIVNSAYGHILFNRDAPGVEGHQCLAVQLVDTLRDEGLGTRHATAVISSRAVKQLATKNGRHDFICTNAVNVMVDTENQLHIFAQMRSMDAVWGYRADRSMWDYLQDWLVLNLTDQYPQLTKGDIMFQVANLHVYPRHFDLLKKTAEHILDEEDRLARRQWMDRRIRLEKMSEQKASRESHPSSQSAQPTLPGMENI